MIQIKNFVFNPFQLNTYVLFDESRQAVIIDPGCYNEDEANQLLAFIEEEQLIPVHCLITHPHVDHLLGCNFVFKTFKLKPIMHETGMELLINAVQYGNIYGFKMEDVIVPDQFLEEGQPIQWGNSKLDVLFTPGHADGSVCFLNRDDAFVITGDVLFHESIGRTDLPGGDSEMLIKNIVTVQGLLTC
ncbi:MAG: MBL fold metallo-hydrolase [Bacteroidota bacterium]